MPNLSQDPPRIDPLNPPYEPAVDAELKRWMPPDTNVDPLKLFRTILHNLPLAEAMRALGGHILGPDLSLSLRERELLIDRTCARAGCEYEWAVHAVSFGRTAGLSSEQIWATAGREVTDVEWTDSDELLLRVADELHDTSRISDALWAQVVQHWTPVQILEILVIAGWYHAISYLANGLRVQPEEWTQRMLWDSRP